MTRVCPNDSIRCHVDDDGLVFCPFCGWRPKKKTAPDQNQSTPRPKRPTVLALEPEMLDFGEVLLDELPMQTCTVRDGENGDIQLQVVDAQNLPKWLRVTSVEGGRLVVLIEAPHYTGGLQAFDQHLQLTADDGRVANLSVRGQFVGPMLTGLPPTLDFKRLQRGNPRRVIVTLTNAGEGVLSIREVVLSQRWLSARKESGDGSTLNLEITVDPDLAGPGSHEGLVQLVTNERDRSPLEVTVLAHVR